MKFSLFGFLFVMWCLILVGGGIAVVILGPFSISGFDESSWFVTSAIKAIIAISLVVLWIFILSKLKNWIFKKELKS